MFNFLGTELTSIVEEHATLIQRPAPAQDIVEPNQRISSHSTPQKTPVSTTFWLTSSNRDHPTKARVTIHGRADRRGRADLETLTARKRQGPPKVARGGNQRKRTGKKPRDSRSRHYNTIHRRITGASAGVQYRVLKIPYGTKMTNDTPERVSELSCSSRGTPEHLQTPSSWGSQDARSTNQ
ncbi:hypothetical protein CDL15_Pgr011156 [Punica granatum]|nr:hypothetical protein CDL15_Pgr011156 [Punica granatum]